MRRAVHIYLIVCRTRSRGNKQHVLTSQMGIFFVLVLAFDQSVVAVSLIFLSPLGNPHCLVFPMEAGSSLLKYSWKDQTVGNPHGRNHRWDGTSSQKVNPQPSLEQLLLWCKMMPKQPFWQFYHNFGHSWDRLDLWVWIWWSLPPKAELLSQCHWLSPSDSPKCPKLSF